MLINFIKISQLSYCWFSFIALKIFTRLEIEGQENIKEIEDHSVIFASNHNSYVDSGISAAAMPKNGVYIKKIAPLRFLVMDKYFSWKIPPIRIFLEAMGSIRVKKAKIRSEGHSHLHHVLSEPVKFLKQGGKIWIYPEGGFHQNGEPKKTRVGVAFLHQQTGAPILPVRIMGNDNIMSKTIPFMPKITTLFGLNKVKVVIGKPIHSLGNLSLDDASSEIMRTIYGLKERAQFSKNN